MLAKAYQEIIVRTGHMPSAVLAIPTDHRLILSKQKCQNKSGTVTRRGEARSGRGFGPRYPTSDRHRHKSRHSRRVIAGTQGRVPPAREGENESERERKGGRAHERACVRATHAQARARTHACTSTHMHIYTHAHAQGHTPVASS